MTLSAAFSLRVAACAAVCAAVLSAAPVQAGTALTRRERECALTAAVPVSPSLDRAHEAYLSGRDEEVERLTRLLPEPPDPDLLYLRALALEALGRQAESRAAFERLSEISSIPEHRQKTLRPPATVLPAAALQAPVVHVGTFSSLGNAVRLSDRLRASGWPSSIEDVPGRRLWRVYAGPFENEAAAIQAERALKAQGHPARRLQRPA